MRLLWSLMWLGCDFGASTKVVGDTAQLAPSVDTGHGEDGDTGEAGEGDLHPSDVDDDEDGFSENEGDCDDTDASVRPGVADECDGADTDCDGTVDDDAVDADPYEPNDDVDFALGEIEADDVFEGSAFLHDGADVDRFSFFFEDTTWDFFTLEVDLRWAADDVLYVMTIENVDTGEILANTFSTAGERSLHYEEDDSFGSTDGGTYRVTISSDGSATCLTGYELSVALSDLL